MRGFTVILCFTAGQVLSQINFIPNGSFETYTACPTMVSSMPATGWKSVQLSPDYYNSCTTNSQVSVPANITGFQAVDCGGAYIGLYSFNAPSANEFVAAQLSAPLVVGQKYFAKINVSLAEKASYVAINRLGIRFTKIQHTNFNPPPTNNFAHVYSNSIITDTLNWVTIFGSFIADSTYTYAEIGNFFNAASTSTVFVKSGYPQAYYYIDNACISTDSLYTLSWGCASANNISHNDLLKAIPVVFPNPCYEGKLHFNKIPGATYIKLYSVLGALVQEMELDPNSNEMDISVFPNGIYYLEIHTSNSVPVRQRIIKQSNI
jgi:hypothetical protein